MRDESRYAGGALPPITWSEESEDQIARHEVMPEEVQEALYTRPRWLAAGRGATLVYSMTNAGRYLLIVIAPALDGGVHVVTARDLNDSERRTFRRKGR